MHILCLGGGPAGLYFGVLMKLQNPAHRITVIERNRPFDTFGWGVVLSDQTLGNLQAADPVSAQLIGDAFNHWDDVEMFFKGRSVRSGGHGFCGIGRKRLLNILQDRCIELGVELVFETDVQDDQVIAAHYGADLVIASDGLDQMRQQDGIAFCERLFAKYLDGNPLMNNATHVRGAAIWIRFPRVVCGHWVHHETIKGKRVPIVLMGDAAHTAHFSIGGGTKLALEDAIELARCFAANPETDAALQAYEAVRSVEVLKIQNAARNSTEWFENVNRYSAMQAEQFFYSMMTRSQRISHENLRVRDAQWLQGYEQWLAKSTEKAPPPPMLLPLTVRGLTLKNRIVVSPMAMYSAVDGVAQDFHLVHLGARALGGAALVFVEMTSPEAEGRITPGCTGLWNDTQMRAFKRIADFVHASGTDAKIGLQLGHSGPKGSTQVGWESHDEPLPEGNWPLLAASAVAYGPTHQVPHAMTRADMDCIKAGFVQSTRYAVEAGFDWLELHCAHGYLLSSFITPLTNLRSDDYGGSVENRCRFPLEVFRAMRDVWPAQLPMSVRISAHDWTPGGNTADDAVDIAKWFKAAGCDVIDVSSGQTTRDAQPVYGRMYQTPFADRIGNEVGIQTIAVGAISEADHVNSIIAAGRADLCALARPHLADPAWTLHEAAKLQSRQVSWPKPYLSGRDQLYREIFKQKELLVQAQRVPSAIK